MKRIWAMGWMAALALMVGAGGLRADDDDSPVDVDAEPVVAKAKSSGVPKQSDSEKKFREFSEVTKGTERIDGFLTMHHKDQHLYAEIKPHQLNQPMLAPIAIA